MIVDPAWDPQKFIRTIEQNSLTLSGILLTHGHHDHTNGVNQILNYKNCPIYYSIGEIKFEPPKTANIAQVKHNDKVKLGNQTIAVLATPGHSSDHISFYTNPNLISGDALFIDGCGRCDLPSSNIEDMYHTLFNVILSLPEETLIHPGHNYSDKKTDTIKNQKKTNRFLRSKNKKEFIRKRNGF
ncbi:MBL fold metallo-hydrolase [bacterium]|nr:MBL fold metallo-hydrolase [bacterium]